MGQGGAEPIWILLQQSRDDETNGRDNGDEQKRWKWQGREMPGPDGQVPVRAREVEEGKLLWGLEGIGELLAELVRSEGANSEEDKIILLDTLV